MTKILKKLLFIAIIGICTSLSAFAQKDDDNKKPPPKKDPPPVIVVKPDKPEKPKDDKSGNDDKKPKKPQASIPGELRLVGIIFD